MQDGYLCRMATIHVSRGFQPTECGFKEDLRLVATAQRALADGCASAADACGQFVRLRRMVVPTDCVGVPSAKLKYAALRPLSVRRRRIAPLRDSNFARHPPEADAKTAKLC